ncbi:uncharacterized protein DDB_G0285917-like [Bactrocera oleae]|uniref:uncharacterized protein DDB_G0285917-like n=1 Tax=Bactrocera oleae TaxID=104688 RepID=UPI00387E5F81
MTYLINNSNNSNNKQANNNYNNNNKPAMQYSKSDFDVFNSSFASSSDFFIYPNNNNSNNNINKSQQDGPYQFQTQVQIHSQSVDNIRNMQIASGSDSDDAAHVSYNNANNIW